MKSFLLSKEGENMYSFAAFVPHPPIIIPEIGQNNTQYCQNTIKAMKELSKRIEDKNIDTVIIISPHTALSPDEMTISHSKQAEGDFKQFDNEDIYLEKQIDVDIAENIFKLSKKAGIKSRLLSTGDKYFIDHGVSVPMYYLQESLPTSSKIVIIGYSMLSKKDHLLFGKAISETVNKSHDNIAVIASGDLSHRLFDPGAEFIGEKFDNLIVEGLKNNNIEDIYKIDNYLQEEAGECGYRSLLILLVSLKGTRYQPEILSYEAPFGVGYLIADFNL